MLRFVTRFLALPAALLLLGLIQTARAQTVFFPNDATIDYAVWATP